MKLTSRQQQILDFIHYALVMNGYPPTRHEIAEAFGFKSDNAAQCHLEALANKNVIRLDAKSARGIQVNEA